MGLGGDWVFFGGWWFYIVFWDFRLFLEVGVMRDRVDLVTEKL